MSGAGLKREAASLVVTEGTEAGRRFSLEEGHDYIVGRGLGADIDVKDRHCSRKHVIVSGGEGAWTATDAGSKNGMKVNGNREATAPLGTGDLLKIGGTVLRFEILSTPRTRRVDLPDLPDEVARGLRRGKGIPPLPRGLVPDGDLKPIEGLDGSARVPIERRALALINSNLLALPAVMADLRQAAATLGMARIRPAVLYATAVQLFGDILDDELRLHATGVAYAARTVAERAAVPHQEEIFMAGFFHDVGRWLMRYAFPRAWRQVEDLARKDGLPLLTAEQDVIGIGHTTLGNQIMVQWKMPELVADAVAFHHAPTDAGDASLAAACVGIGDLAIHALGIGVDEGDRSVGVSDAAWEELDISLSSVENIMGAVDRETFRMREMAEILADAPPREAEAGSP